MNESQTEEIMEKCVNKIEELKERVSKLENEMEKFKEILSEKNLKNLETLKINYSSKFNNFTSENKTFEEKEIKDMENEKLEQKLYIESKNEEQNILNKENEILDKVENISEYSKHEDTITKQNAKISELSDKLKEKEEENENLKKAIKSKNEEIETLKNNQNKLNLKISRLDEVIRKNNFKISEQEDTIRKKNAELEKFSNFKKIEEIFSEYDSIPKEERKKYDSLLKPELGKDVFLFLAISKFENLKEFLQQDFLKNENFYPVLIDLYDYVFEIKNKEFDEEVYERIESEPGTKYNPITQIVSENGKSDGEIEKTIITGYQRKRDGKVLYKSIVLLK